LKDVALKGIRSLEMHTPFLVLKPVNLLFYNLHHFVGSGPEAATVFGNSPLVKSSWPTLASLWVGLLILNFGD